MHCLIVIPARLESQRLPNKVLADIGGKPMIVRVWERCMATEWPVVVATDSADVVSALPAARVVMTGACVSGTDRVAAALRVIESEPNIVINCQGDIPFISPDFLRLLGRGLQENPSCQWATLTSVDRSVKVMPFERCTERKHIGVYGFRLAALKEFSTRPQSEAEKRMGLEQLRIVDIPHLYVDAPYFPMEVNTADDLIQVRHVVNALRDHEIRQDLGHNAADHSKTAHRAA